MDESLEVNPCHCGKPARLAATTRYPIEFDAVFNEYYLRGADGKAIMRYCFWCGGRLPASKRGDFFTSPSQKEQEEVWRILLNVKSAQEALTRLGPPDETLERGSCDIVENMVEKKTHRCSSRWDTLILDVQEMPDGTINTMFYGKCIGPPPTGETANKRPHWWQLWRRRH